MIAVIFEVTPKATGKESYFEIAQSLKEELSCIDGFISVERFQSLINPDTFLSLSFWRDEDAVKEWRNSIRHQFAQKQGRHEIFFNYRLRVAEVTRDYGMNDRRQAPTDLA